MKRVRRWLFNGLAALSLLLCMATAGLWPRSYYLGDAFVNASRNATYYGLDSDTGVVTFSYAFETTDTDLINGPYWYYGHERSGLRRFRAPPDWHIAGFAYRRVSNTVTNTYGSVTQIARDVEIPYWFFLFAFLSLPSWWFLKWRSRARPAGFCAQCGYDLRATPQQCPECGMVVAREPA
jgi:hypothetical protein